MRAAGCDIDWFVLAKLDFVIATHSFAENLLLRPAREPLTPGQPEAGSELQDAFMSPTPDALYELLQRERPSSLRHERATALRLLKRLPATDTRARGGRDPAPDSGGQAGDEVVVRGDELSPRGRDADIHVVEVKRILEGLAAYAGPAVDGFVRNPFRELPGGWAARSTRRCSRRTATRRSAATWCGAKELRHAQCGRLLARWGPPSAGAPLAVGGGGSAA